MRLMFLICSLILSFGLHAADKFPGIKALMTDEELAASGINKLSEQEISGLNQWLIRYTANEAHLVKHTKEVKKKSFEALDSKIIGLFRGWTGKTKFKLENGQVWQQRYSNKWTTKIENPEVRITRNTLGFYDLEVMAKGRKIGVRRIK